MYIFVAQVAIAEFSPLYCASIFSTNCEIKKILPVAVGYSLLVYILSKTV